MEDKYISRGWFPPPLMLRVSGSFDVQVGMPASINRSDFDVQRSPFATQK